jgi:hypothetical protein
MRLIELNEGFYLREDGREKSTEMKGAVEEALLFLREKTL